MRAVERGARWGRNTERNLHVSFRVRVDTSQPPASIFLPTTYPNYENTRFLGVISGEVTGFVSDFLSSSDRQTDSRFLVADERFSLYGLRPTFVGHNICGQMVSALLCTPPPRADSLPGTFDFWSPLFVPHRAPERRPDPKKPRGTLYEREERERENAECSCLLPTLKISRDTSNHPTRHPSTTCAVVLSSIANHL